MNDIKSNVVNLGSNDNPYFLSQYIKDKVIHPLDQFGSDRDTAITNAVSLLTSNRYGTIEIPPLNQGDHVKYLIANEDKDHNLRLNIITVSNYYPVNNEDRVISINGNKSWVVGDIIYNNDFESNKFVGWVCTKSGIPGTWKAFQKLSNWFSEIDVLDSKPDPSILQLGRQIICKVNGSYELLCCVNTNTDKNPVYEWKGYISEQALTSTITNSLAPINNSLNNKANKSDLTPINNSLNNKANKSDLTPINNSLNDKADKSELSKYALINNIPSMVNSTLDISTNELTMSQSTVSGSIIRFGKLRFIRIFSNGDTSSGVLCNLEKRDAPANNVSITEWVALNDSSGYGPRNFTIPKNGTTLSVNDNFFIGGSWIIYTVA